jgi:hypothetical protein
MISSALVTLSTQLRPHAVASIGDHIVGPAVRRAAL